MSAGTPDIKKRAALVAAFITVFLDLLNFGLIIPDVQLRSEDLGLRGLALGLAIAAYSISQLIFAPFLGRLSDRVGRRRVLLITCALSIVGGGLWAFSENLVFLYLSRILLGVAGANVGVVYAYVSDVTEPNERAKSLGILGAAFGLGFLLGPVSGAFLVKFNEGHPYYLGAASALFGLINLLYVWRGMPDIPPADSSAASAGIAAQFRLVGRALRTPGLGLLLAIFFMINLGFSNLESTYFRLMENVYRLDQEQTALILTWVGIVSAFIQGYFIRKLLVRFSEVTLLRISYCILIPTFITVPFAQPWVPVLIGAFLLGAASGVAQPCLSSLISRSAPAAVAGGLFGVNQALGALARIIGPGLGNTLFEITYWLPYAAGALIMAPVLALMWRIQPPPETESGDSPAVPAH